MEVQESAIYRHRLWWTGAVYLLEPSLIYASNSLKIFFQRHLVYSEGLVWVGFGRLFQIGMCLSLACSLLVYRKTTDFVMLNFESYYFVEMFIRSKDALMDPLGLLANRSVVSTNTVTGLSPSYLHPFYFSCLLGIAKTLSSILSKRGVSG